MNTAVYTDDASEQQIISDALKKCGMEYLRPASVTVFSDYADFCCALSFRRFDLLLIAQDGAFSLALMEAIRQFSPDTPVIWFSDMDFAVRSYEYEVVWFGKKPVELPALRKAFQRLMDRTRKKPAYLTMID